VKAGDMVRFVGHANFYKGRIGVVCKIYGTSLHAAPDSALVYFAGAERQGRATPLKSVHRPAGRHAKSGLHPMALDELKKI
tara:strand:+ start:454 stop:696 length:243 start_codon:yes stop_codon:yes gene_type:complete